MAVIKFLRDITGLFNWSTDENPTSQQDYQNAVKNWQETEKNLVDAVLWQPETAYDAGNQVRTPSLPSECVLVCTTAGTSGANEPDYTGVVIGNTVADGTAEWLVSKALSTATVGTVETNSPASNVSVSSGSAKTITSVSLGAGTWVVTGHIYIQSANITADKFYAVGLGLYTNTLNQSDEGTIATTPSIVTNVSLQTTRILTLNATTTIYMCVLATANTTVNSASSMTAVRIV